MSQWEISKQIDFCYGHRVYVQTTDEEFSLNRAPKCRHIHGHQGEVHVYLKAEELDDQGMVVDFCRLEWLKKFLDDTVDHKFIMDRNDPLFPFISRERPFLNNPILVPGTDFSVGWSLDPISLDPVESPSFEELSGGLVVVDFVPTSENLSKWLYDLVKVKMAKLNVKISKIDWWETPKSCSTYSG